MWQFCSEAQQFAARRDSYEFMNNYHEIMNSLFVNKFKVYLIFFQSVGAFMKTDR